MYNAKITFYNNSNVFDEIIKILQERDFKYSFETSQHCIYIKLSIFSLLRGKYILYNDLNTDSIIINDYHVKEFDVLFE